MMLAGDGRAVKKKAPRRADRWSDFFFFFLTRELREL